MACVSYTVHRSGRATGPDPGCGDLEFREGPTRSEIQGPQVRSAKGQVTHHLWRLDDADDVTGGRDHPDAAGAHAPHPPRGIDFEAVRDAGSGRGHLAEHPIITQATILRVGESIPGCTRDALEIPVVPRSCACIVMPPGRSPRDSACVGSHQCGPGGGSTEARLFADDARDHGQERRRVSAHTMHVYRIALVVCSI